MTKHSKPRQLLLPVFQFILAVIVLITGGATDASAQGKTIHDSVSHVGRTISDASMAEPLSAERWKETLDERREKWREMIGLSPLPQRTPLKAKVKGRLPAVLYLTGHSEGKIRKTYQQNPRWFGQHGYIALVLDPMQLGESQGYLRRDDRIEAQVICWPS